MRSYYHSPSFGQNPEFANDYEPKETFKIIREWTNLTQEELGKEMNKTRRTWAKEIESGKNRFYYSDLLKIAKNII